MTTEEMLTLREAAAEARVSERQMRRFVASGVVPSWRPSPQIIRIPKNELMKRMGGEVAE